MFCLCLLGCGRVGFDKTGDGGTGGESSDGALDVMIMAQSCTATQVPLTLEFSPVRDVIAAEIPGGTALGFITGTSSALAGVVLDASLVPNAVPPYRTSPATFQLYTYSNASLFWDGTNLTGSVSVPEDSSCFIKTYLPDMSIYAVANQRPNCLTGEPSVAKAGAQTVSTWYGGATLFYNALMGDGSPGSPDRSVVMPAAIENLSAASGERIVVALDVANGDCDYVLTDGSGNANSGRLIPTCARPHIRATAATTFTYVFEDTATTFGIGQVEVTAVSYMSMPTTRGFAGRFPRLFTVGGDVLVAFRNANDSLGVMRAADGTRPPISGLPGAPDAFEVAGPYVFATFGDKVYAITCN